jgi:hypothetical protein
MISVGHDAGAVFTAVLPACVGTGPATAAGTPGAVPAGAPPGTTPVAP